jgi:thiol-disulfide isomerase/thioredoxin
VFIKMRFRIITSTGLVIIWLLSSFSYKHQPRVLSFNDLEPHLYLSNDTTYLVNFWASWCTPCVDELPAFEKIEEEYKSKKVKVLLVSLDFPNQVESRLVPFIEKYQINSEVLVLNDPDANKWIDKVDKKWSGALPATLIYNSKTRDFREGSFTYEELKIIVEQKIQSP